MCTLAVTSFGTMLQGSVGTYGEHVGLVHAVRHAIASGLEVGTVLDLYDSLPEHHVPQQGSELGRRVVKALEAFLDACRTVRADSELRAQLWSMEMDSIMLLAYERLDGLEPEWRYGVHLVCLCV